MQLSKATALGAVILATVAVSISSPATADIPGAHPAYLHAIADLRDARNLMKDPSHVAGANAHESQAIQEITYAIMDIKKAGIDDGKSLTTVTPVDATLDHPGRLHQALQALKKAHADIDEAEQDTSVLVLRKHSLLHIDHAIALDKVAIREIQTGH